MSHWLSERRRRALRVVSIRWRRHAIFLLGGIAVGAVAVALALLADQAQRLFALLLSWRREAAFVVTPLGFMLSVFLTNRYFPNSQGSGIPQAIAARQLDDQAARGRAGVDAHRRRQDPAARCSGLLCGASAGREGPTVQVGASIMFAIGRLSPRRQAGLILAGASAGVAAAFNTPLAGIVFGIEEMSRAFEARTSGLIIGARDRRRPHLARAGRQLHLFRRQRGHAARRRSTGSPCRFAASSAGSPAGCSAAL